MSLSDVLRPAKDSDDIGGFDQNEASDLGLHVRQCARRYRTLDAKLTFAIRLILALAALEVLTKFPSGWSWVLKLFS